MNVIIEKSALSNLWNIRTEGGKRVDGGYRTMRDAKAAAKINGWNIIRTNR